ncbi:MAG: 2-oxoacid:acceptor oxidoreductase subunit alpha [Opitutales bacterium]|nr:2-oxoacid:acceptor oxidoreductase subunit alpha [Opitutales bacterium]
MTSSRENPAGTAYTAPETLNDAVIRIAGNSQDGIQSVGAMLARLAGRSEMEVMTYMTIPATISGGPSIFQVHMGSGRVLSAGDAADILVAFYQHSYDDHLESLRDGGVLLYDSTNVEPDLDVLRERRITPVPVPMTSLTIEILGGTGKKKGKNIFLLGLIAQTFRLDMDKIRRLLAEVFGHKDESVLRNALLALEGGYAYSIGDMLSFFTFEEPRLAEGEAAVTKVTMTGNQALAYGAIAAGIRFGAAYPITPWTEVMEQLRCDLPGYRGSFIQTEDELAGIAAALGAAYGGVPAMTGSSGPGLALKSEAISFAVMAEIPLLIVDVQRGGPSTGLPTNVEQSDLNLALHAGHGDAPRVVLAAANVEDCFHLVIEAVRIAHEYSVPVIFLSDQAIATRIEAFPFPDLTSVVRFPGAMPVIADSYKPYSLDRITRHLPPGSRILDGKYPNVTGLEHDESGHPSANSKVHMAMTAKRRTKLEVLAETLPCPEVRGPESGELLLVGWGSTMGVIREAVDRAAAKGACYSAVHLRYLNPLPPGLEELFRHFERVLVVEMNDRDTNGCGQLARVLRAQYALPHVGGITKTDGLSFRIGELLSRIEETVDSRPSAAGPPAEPANFSH